MIIVVPSCGRPENVAHMRTLCSRSVWVVPPTEAEVYEREGAQVSPTGGRDGLGFVINGVLDRAGDETVAIVDDDIRKVLAVDVENGTSVPITATEALEEMESRLLMTDYRLMGSAPTNNPYFSKRMTSINLFAKSTSWVIRPSELRMDTNLRVKGDYDFNLQHYERFGGWLRADDLIFDNQQRVQRGGVGALRREGRNEEAIEYLLAKWPGLVKRHATREGEVTLTVPRRR